jgi:WD40 repeat protein/tetratricopeptide (TPR) repeat protein
MGMQKDKELNKVIHRKIGNAIVKIFVADDFQGTGFFITPDGYVLTAYHCIGDCPPDIIIETRFNGKISAQLDTNKSLKTYDIAVLKTDHEPSHCLPLGFISESLHQADKVIAIGYPAGHRADSKLGVFPGSISQLRGNKIDLPNAIKGKGQSGGPVYHYATRRIIGVASGAFKQDILMDTGLAVRFEALFKQWKELEAINNQVASSWDKELRPGIFSFVPRFLKFQRESREKKEILQSLTQLMERLGLSEQLKLSDEFIPYDKNRLQQIKEIQTQLKRLSLDDPKYNRILIMTGCVLSSTGDPTKVDEAKYWFSQVRENSQDKEERALASFNLFQIHLRHKLYDKALEDLKVAIEIDPQHYALHNVHQYPIEKLLGAGGMGCVFLCQNLNPLIPDERVVVKCFWESRKGSPDEVFKEALAMSKVAGQYVPKPLECGYVDDIKQERAFFVTEYIDGMIDGESWLKQKGKLDLEMGLKVGLEIAKGLQVAHCARIYHLDLKPANILLKRINKKIVVKIIDFGLSHVATSLRQQAARRQSQIGLSVFGQKVFGTLDYASPEQLDPKQPEKPGAKSDIFGFGATMYHLLTGEKPNPFLESELPEIPVLRNLLGDCVKKEPSQRPKSAQQLVQQWMLLVVPEQDRAKPNANQYYKERCILQDHRGAVWSIAFSPDGCILASGSNDGSIKLWNVSMDEVLQTLTGHSQSVYSVAFSPDGRILASGSNDETVKLWNVDTGQVLQTLQGHESKVHSVVFHPTKSILVSGSDDKTILWEVDANTSKELQTLPGYETIAFSPDGNILALASNDKTIKLRNISTGKMLETQQKPDKSVKKFAFTPDGKILASGGKNIILWEVSTGKKLQTLPESDVRTVAFNHDGRILVSNSINDTIKLWGISTGRVLKTLKGHGKSSVCAVAFSPCGRFLASGNFDKTVKLWERK